MKKLLVLVLALALVLSFSITALAAGNGNGHGNGTSNGNGNNAITENVDTTITDENTPNGQQNKEENALKKAFKLELNQEKKALQQQKCDLEAQILSLQLEYNAAIAAGDPDGTAAAILESINTLESQIAGLQAQIKETINERFMVTKTMYTAEELAQFENADALIEQMYADAYTLEAGSITVKNNIIKLEAPAYIKGGVTLIPVRTITEELGATVDYDTENKTVTVSLNNTIVVFAIGSTTVTIDGTVVDMAQPANITCGRTYIPLRFLAETFGLNVTWDDENEIIDIDGEEITEDPIDDPVEDPVEDPVDDPVDDPADGGSENSI